MKIETVFTCNTCGERIEYDTENEALLIHQHCKMQK